MARLRPLFLGIGLMLVGITSATTGAAASLLGMLHLPRTVRPDVPGAEVVEITAQDAAVLKASWLPPPPGSVRCVLVLHGSGGWRERGARFTPMLHDSDYGILAPDSRAHGESGGDKVTYGILEKYDALAWAQWMKRQGCEALFGLGESLGSSVLILASEIEPVFAAIVADCPFADLLDAAEDRMVRGLPFPKAIARPLARIGVEADSIFARAMYDLDFAAVRPVESIKRVDTPILLIHGTADNRVPPQNSEALAAAKPDTTELWLVPGARHVGSFRVAPDEYSRRVLDWFQAR